MDNKAFKFEAVSAEEIQVLKTKLVQSGITVNVWPNAASNSFKIEGHGIKADATYDPGSLELEVTINNKPFYISLEKIQNGIGEFLNSNSVADVDNKTVEVTKDDN